MRCRPLRSTWKTAAHASSTVLCNNDVSDKGLLWIEPECAALHFKTSQYSNDYLKKKKKKQSEQTLFGLKPPKDGIRELCVAPEFVGLRGLSWCLRRGVWAGLCRNPPQHLSHGPVAPCTATLTSDPAKGRGRQHRSAGKVIRVIRADTQGLVTVAVDNGLFSLRQRPVCAVLQTKQTRLILFFLPLLLSREWKCLNCN